MVGTLWRGVSEFCACMHEFLPLRLWAARQSSSLSWHSFGSCKALGIHPKSVRVPCMRELVLNWVIHVWENPDGRTYGRDKLWGHLVFTGMPSPAVTAAAAESRHCTDSTTGPGDLPPGRSHGPAYPRDLCTIRQSGCPDTNCLPAPRFLKGGTQTTSRCGWGRPLQPVEAPIATSQGKGLLSPCRAPISMLALCNLPRRDRHCVPASSTSTYSAWASRGKGKQTHVASPGALFVLHPSMTDSFPNPHPPISCIPPTRI